MSKRQDARFVRRLETEFSAAGKNFRGISSDLSSNGLFIRTNHAFKPGTIVEILLHLPDGSESKLKGSVRRALKTTVVSLKNGMGVELIEKDSNYTNFILTFSNDFTENEPRAQSRPSQPDTPSGPKDDDKPEPIVPDFLIIACSACGVKNKVSIIRLSQGPKCGKCGAFLKAD